MSRPRLLDLYCRKGGAAMGYIRAGFEVVGRHEGDMFAVYGDGGGKGSIEDWQQAMGIDWMSDRRDLAEAIPPAYTEYIGRQLMAHLLREAA